MQGFFIEIPRAHAERVPADYLRRQTVKSAERFITPELKSFEDEVLGARDKALAREKELYRRTAGRTDRRTACAAGNRRRASPASMRSPAWRSAPTACSGCEPVLVDEPVYQVTAGRHPVVERFSGTSFVPNDLTFDDSRRMLIVTGPNMGGKSTYMRQAALIAVLAHMGSFVPAASAPIGPMDRVFTRIGAADDLAGGRSTFMVEMTETANILHNATRAQPGADGRDRPRHQHLRRPVAGLGRGAVPGRPGCARSRCSPRTTSSSPRWPQEMPGVVNLHLDATEHGEDLVFLHAVREGPANRSYGLAVARLAGVPREVISAAREYLQMLESQRPGPAPTWTPQVELPLFAAPAPSPLALRLAELKPDELSPRDALQLLYDLQQAAVKSLKGD